MIPTELAALNAQLSTRRHRALIWVAAERDQCDLIAAELASRLSSTLGDGVVLSNRACGYANSVMPTARASQLLGQTRPWAIYDAFSGFNPNSFAQLAGTIAAGGWLVLLSPEAGDWPRYDDPEYQKLKVEPWTAQMLEPRYLRRLVRLLESDKGVLRLRPDSRDLPSWPPVPGREAPVQPPYMSIDQQQVVEQLVTRVQRGRCAVVVCADRGRGKSAAVGLALTRISQQRRLRVLLSAPSRQALSAVFERIESELGALVWQGEYAVIGQLELSYMTPAEALKRLPPADLLVIDEAAAVATPVLRGLSTHYHRLIFATTQHGYEGNGRGFTLRFLDELKRLVPRVQELQMQAPIRWAADDPLEQQVSRLLLLDAEPVEPVFSGDQRLTISRIPREQLSADEPLLRQLFGLLILAHYRTTPGDLRVLLDSPNLQVNLLRRGAGLVGCALVAREGELSEELAQGVWEGHRRPTGHLLPQALIAHEGELAVASWRAWRVLRIAIHPQLQQQGMGRQLLNAIVEQAREEGVDYLGASFAATTALLRYWSVCDFWPVRVGDQLDPVSGSHSVMVLNPLSDRCQLWFRGMRERYARRLRYRLSGALSSLPVELMPALFAALPRLEPTSEERARLHGFAEHQRSLESTLVELDLLLLATVQDWHRLGLSVDDQALLVARVWHQQPPVAVERPSGRHAQLKRLRELTSSLLDAWDSVRKTEG
ncbi:tRNA(Met) cytidine acetyltransferase TmcA [Marinobacterium zhoushanense]|uniref:tRNA(Met) cytidine acetyltransferase TmcA n=1 Tax=Marinobacterium zhoushanense TaxID=1679163 RepID=A0ABQ1KI71_9GAMM|nr:GNAT family N-acetyltransferase [Marinobacterium zhoushanense]GGC01083.1 tRNA(Met) cytidine acetyltransferase TmcA [Marinobacterium zhoushanense]